MTKLARGISASGACLFPLLSLFGCPNSELAPIGPCTVSGVFDTITGERNDKVDLLFVVDNSGSMAEEQANLALRLPELVKTLASGEFKNAAGEVTRTFTPVKSLHLAVVSSDMGTNGVEDVAKLSTDCGADSPSGRAFGDDGLLLSRIDATDPSCVQGEAPYLSFAAGDDPQALGTSFGCITRLGVNGCGFEQQLEAMLKALAPSKDNSFSRGSTGHGDAENAGFMRPDSVVAVIHVTDEEDCSIPDASGSLFNRDMQGANINVSCGLNPSLLHAPERFIKGLQLLRPEHPDQIIFAAIAGIPVEAEGMLTTDGQQDFDAILSLEAMQFMPYMKPGETRTLPRPACTLKAASAGEEDANASPARRFVEVAKGFGKNGIIRSICQTDFSSALDAIIVKIADQLQGACLERTLIADPTSKLAPCGLVEVLPRDKQLTSDCLASKGRRFLEKRKDEDGQDHIVCQINQLAVDKTNDRCEPNGEANPVECLDGNPNTADDRDNPKITDAMVGWYYDDFSAELKANKQCDKQRIAFTEGAEQENGSEVRFECLQPVFSVFANPRGVDAVNKPCEGNAKTCTDAQTESYPSLICDATRNTCQIECNENANCPDGWVCDKSGERSICLNPTCPPQ